MEFVAVREEPICQPEGFVPFGTTVDVPSPPEDPHAFPNVHTFLFPKLEKGNMTDPDLLIPIVLKTDKDFGTWKDDL